MTVQLRTQTIAQQDVLGDSQIKANSSQGQSDSELSPDRHVPPKSSKMLDSQSSEKPTDITQIHDEAEQEFVFDLPDMLIENENLEAGDALLNNEKVDSVNQDTPNELQAFIQNPSAQRFKAHQTTLPEGLAEQKLVQNNIASPLTLVGNGTEVNAAALTQPIVSNIDTMSNVSDHDTLPIQIQPVSGVLNDTAKITTTLDVIVPIIQSDKVISKSQQGESLIKTSGASTQIQDQYLATRFLSENSSNSNNVNIKPITADSVNGLTTPIVLNDEKDFQKGLTQQLLGSVDQREHTLLKSGVGANTDNQPVQQWRKEQLTANTNEWGQRLLHVLSDKVNLQIGQQVQRAQIRLDPPQLGSIDISISVEGDKTTVHLVAGNAQIREAMQQTLDQLRQSLSQTGEVTVEVDVGEKQQQSGNSSDTPEIDIAENITVEEDITLKTTENSASDWLNRLV